MAKKAMLVILYITGFALFSSWNRVRPHIYLGGGALMPIIMAWHPL